MEPRGEPLLPGREIKAAPDPLRTEATGLKVSGERLRSDTPEPARLEALSEGQAGEAWLAGLADGAEKARSGPNEEGETP